MGRCERVCKGRAQFSRVRLSNFCPRGALIPASQLVVSAVCATAEALFAGTGKAQAMQIVLTDMCREEPSSFSPWGSKLAKLRCVETDPRLGEALGHGR